MIKYYSDLTADDRKSILKKELSNNFKDLDKDQRLEFVLYLVDKLDMEVPIDELIKIFEESRLHVI